MLKVIIADRKNHADALVRRNIEKWEAKNHHYPHLFVPGGTLALQPGWCDDCGGRAWTPATGAEGYCPKCQRKRDKAPAGFHRP